MIALFIEVILIVSERFITLYCNKDPKELYYLFIYLFIKKWKRIGIIRIK